MLHCFTVHALFMFRISTRVGSGQFGEVCKGIWSVSGTTKEIAIKALKPGSREDEKLKLLQEAAIMGQFFHPNVVRLYGVVTVDEPVSDDMVKFIQLLLNSLIYT